jgi:hypothetical protein
MKLYSLSNFDRLYLRQYRSYEQTSKHRTALFWPEKGFGTSLGCHRYFSMTQLPLQVKRTVCNHWSCEVVNLIFELSAMTPFWQETLFPFSQGQGAIPQNMSPEKRG